MFVHRADTGASTSAMCDLPLLTGETASHLNPSLAVRLPLSRSASRDNVDDNPSCGGDDDIPSTIGGPCCRTLSAAELSMSSRGAESGFLEPRAGGGRGREESLLQPRGDEVSIGTAGRSSTSSQHSRVTAAEVHISSGGEVTPSGERPPQALGSEAPTVGEHSGLLPEASQGEQGDPGAESEGVPLLKTTEASPSEDDGQDRVEEAELSHGIDDTGLTHAEEPNTSGEETALLGKERAARDSTSDEDVPTDAGVDTETIQLHTANSDGDDTPTHGQ